MLVLVGTVRLPPERVGEARAVMAAMIEASRAEDGCVSYAYGEDVMDPGLIRITEVWRDRAALDAHFQSAHIAAWRAEFPRLGIGERRMSAYEAGEPIPV